jgi:hypothetical protein
MLGHASITVTVNICSHVLPDMQDSADDAMEARCRKDNITRVAAKAPVSASRPFIGVHKKPRFAGDL